MNEYKVTYRDSKGDMTFCDTYYTLESALMRYNKVAEKFDTWADVKLTAEIVMMGRA